VPEQGASNGVEGSVQLKVYTTCCIFEDGTVPCDTPINPTNNEITLDIQLTDRAGNASNIITTEVITLFCE